MIENKMRPIIVLLWVFLLAIAGANAQAPSPHSNDERIIFEGKVLEVGPSPNSSSGGVEVYQLAKYRIDRLILGEFDRPDVLIDHLLLSGDELKKIKKGQRVCVTFLASADIGHRYDDEVLRKSSDNPKFFYIGSVHTRFSQSPCRKR